jgi:carboxyl-terminal processing protease
VPFERAATYAQGLHALDREVARALLRYPARAVARPLIYGAIAGELATVRDPYTVFFDPKQYRAFVGFLNPSSFGGIGVVLAVTNAPPRLKVENVIPGAPAERAGMRAGDEIVSVDGRALGDLGVANVQMRLRGGIGSTVRIGIVRNGTPLAQPLTVVRAAVRAPDVYARLLGEVGYIQLSSYGANAATELEAALRRLRAQGARGWILDLRGDGGGYRDVAVRVTSAFVPRGRLLTVEARGGRRTTLDSLGAAFVPRPLVALVDVNTASAAEITASAIQDTGAGTLVGARTYGKGLVQQVVPLPDGSALKLTIERYLTAAGKDIDRRGIAPDVALEQPAGALAGDPASDPQLARALALVRDRLAHAP